MSIDASDSQIGGVLKESAPSKSAMEFFKDSTHDIEYSATHDLLS